MPASNRNVNRSWSDPSWLSLAALAGLLALVVILSSLPAAATASRHTDDRPDSVPCASCTTAAQRVLTIGMTVADMDRSLDFYTDVLHFQKESDVEVAAEWFERLHGVFGARARVSTLRLGDDRIELTQYLAPEGRPIPPDSRSNDLWFQHIAIIVRDMDEAYAHLRQHDVRHASAGPQTIPDWNQAAAGIRAFYFKDPDGHVLEILEFPPDKGRPKWREANRADDLFLGIDHTAIVVRDTGASIAFYREALGMEVAGKSENHGVEQERLNNVFGARLRITSLRCAGDEHSPAIELLEYLAPPGGREAPPDSRASDLWHWQITVQAAEAQDSFRIMLGRGEAIVSGDVVAFDGDMPAHASGFMVRDPDGHTIRVLQPRPGIVP